MDCGKGRRQVREGRPGEKVSGGSWLAGVKSLWTRLWVGKAASGEEAPWQSGIDFQKMVRELVESADSANEGEKPGPETVAEAVVDLAKMSGRLTDWTVLVMRSHLALERRVRWLERCVIVIGTLVLFFLGMIFAALLR